MNIAHNNSRFSIKYRAKMSLLNNIISSRVVLKLLTPLVFSIAFTMQKLVVVFFRGLISWSINRTLQLSTVNHHLHKSCTKALLGRIPQDAVLTFFLVHLVKMQQSNNNQNNLFVNANQFDEIRSCNRFIPTVRYGGILRQGFQGLWRRLMI